MERTQRTHTEEFYEVVDSDFTIAELAPKLLEWERVYNTVRPHQALGYLTTAAVLATLSTTWQKGGDASLIYRTSTFA